MRSAGAECCRNGDRMAGHRASRMRRPPRPLLEWGRPRYARAEEHGGKDDRMDNSGVGQPMNKARRRGLNRLSGLRNLLVDAKPLLYRLAWGMEIHPIAPYSLCVQFD